MLEVRIWGVQKSMAFLSLDSYDASVLPDGSFEMELPNNKKYGWQILLLKVDKNDQSNEFKKIQSNRIEVKWGKKGWDLDRIGEETFLLEYSEQLANALDEDLKEKLTLKKVVKVGIDGQIVEASLKNG